MRLYKFLILPLIGLILSVLAFVPLLSQEGAFYGYQSPLKIADYAPEFGDQTSKVLLIIVDGLRADTADSTSTWKEFGWAIGTLRTRPPSWSNPCFANIITGTWQEFHSVTSNEFEEQIPIEHIFSFTSTSFVTAFSGDEGSRALIGQSATYIFSTPSPESPEEEDQLILEKAKEFLKFSPSFLLVHFNQVDHYSHYAGTLSSRTAQALKDVDNLIMELIQNVDLSQYTVIITSDHGHLDRGGHGGGEEVVLNTPLLMFGANVKKGVEVSGSQIDIIPTVCALTGAPVPRYSLGMPLWDALNVPIEFKAKFSLRILMQRGRFADAYSRMLGTNYSPIDLASMEQTTDPEKLFSSAENAREALDGQIQEWRSQKILEERTSRLWAPILASALILMLIIFAFKGRWAFTLLNAIVALIVFLLIFTQILGLSFSFSYLYAGSFLEFFLIFGVPLLISEILLSLLLPLQLKKAKRQELVKFQQQFLFLASLLLLLLFSFVYYSNGLSSPWHLPDFTLGFMGLALLLMIIWNGLFLVFLPPAFWGLWRLIKR